MISKHLLGLTWVKHRLAFRDNLCKVGHLPLLAHERDIIFGELLLLLLLFIVLSLLLLLSLLGRLLAGVVVRIHLHTISSNRI